MVGPVGWEADVVLRDGSVAHVRPIRPDDAPAVQDMHLRQSPESRYLRFFAPVDALSERELTRFTHVDGVMRVALVVLLGDAIIGIGRFDRLDDEPELADVAFNVADAHHGKGIGSMLLEHLAAVADELGVRRFRADVLPQNTPMMRVFLDAGYEVSHEFDDGVIAVAFDLEPTERSRAVQAAREHRAEARSLAPLLDPAGVVVVGVSRSRPSVGRRLLEHVVAGGYAGRVWAINRAAALGETVAGVPLLRGWDELPDDAVPDVVVLAVPAADVTAHVVAAGEAGAHALVVVSAGFADAGAEGAAAQSRLVQLAHVHGMRLLGPAAVGVVSAAASLNLTLSPRAPAPGRLGIFTQSGGVASAVLVEVARRGIGLASFVGAGNRADVSGNDVMQYWLDDDATDVVALHLQSMGNARKLSRVARALGARKPVVVVRPGVGVPAGHQVRAAADPRALDAVLDQAGVIVARSVREALDIAKVGLLGVPAGPRLGAVANSPELVAHVADAAAAEGLELARVETVRAEETLAGHVAALEGLLADEGIDAVVAAFMPPADVPDAELVGAVRERVAGARVPCVVSFLGMPDQDATGPAELAMPEDAVTALAALARYGAWRLGAAEPAWRPPGVRRREVARVVDRVLDGAPEGRDLTEDEVAEVLGGYGIGIGPGTMVTGESSAAPAPPDTGPSEGTVRIRVASAEDPALGPVVTVSVAGLATDVFDDVAHVVPPATLPDVERAVRSLRAFPLLRGVDLAVLVDLVARVATLADDVPELARLVLDPVLAGPDGCTVGAATATLRPSAGRVDPAVRVLD